jgi:hypothetical protein
VRQAHGRRTPALIGDKLALALMRAECLYALEVQAGERTGPWSDEAAT